jgi:hypothetical protein
MIDHPVVSGCKGVCSPGTRTEINSINRITGYLNNTIFIAETDKMDTSEF